MMFVPTVTFHGAFQKSALKSFTFCPDFNSLLDEMEEWQLKLQAKNAQLLRTALHDPLTGLANRAAFRSSINALMNDHAAHSSSALLFLDGDNFKFINDTRATQRGIGS